MRETAEGIVVSQAVDRVRVRVYRTGTCENCSCVLSTACTPEEVDRRRGILGSLLRQSSVIEIEALNEAGAVPGDRVELQLRSNASVVKASALLYLIPAVMFVVGVVGGGWWGVTRWGLSGDAVILVQVACGFGLMMVSFAFAALYARRRERAEFTPIATKVLFKAEGQHPPSPSRSTSTP
ncbi:MAG: SoxR reducing system RseC family protein [Candidatus Bipolaricaulota bacterium]|nr:SoxR reducing system RseC family protein [Candidatus Bipolaricaulota bacterium]MDW8030470.1 SoxR reducing system RseC family protein [Candidatus Bipolaricaulota bacterium]